MTASQRKATAAHRKRAAERGLVRVEVTVPRTAVKVVQQFAETLRMQSASTEPAAADRKALTLLEVFASDLPDEYFEGVFDHPRTDMPRDVDL